MLPTLKFEHISLTPFSKMRVDLAAQVCNHAIRPDLCTLSYVTVDQVALKAIALGRGSLIAKIDIKSAYRLIPICPRDKKWLGMEWRGEVYMDGMLPFGLRSAPKIFNAVADGLEWCVARAGVQCVYPLFRRFRCPRTTKLGRLPVVSRHMKTCLRGARSDISSREAGRS